MASTSSPSRTSSGAAKVAGLRPVSSTRSSARSREESAATTAASRGSLSPLSRTCTVLASPTTWALVMISPSAVTIRPVPMLSPAWPLRTWIDCTATTLGARSFATVSTSRRGSGALRGSTTLTPSVDGLRNGSARCCAQRTPISAPTRPANHTIITIPMPSHTWRAGRPNSLRGSDGPNGSSSKVGSGNGASNSGGGKFDSMMDVLSADRQTFLRRVGSGRWVGDKNKPRRACARRGCCWLPQVGPRTAESAGLDLDLDVHACRQLDALQAVDGLGVGIDDVDQALVDAHLEVLARVLVDVRATDDRVAMLVGRQRDRTANRCAGARHGFDDLARRLGDDLVVECLEANADALCHGSSAHLVILVTRPAPTVRPPSRIANLRPSSMAIGLPNSTVIATLSPGITISVPSGNWIVPVTSVVRKKNCGR